MLINYNLLYYIQVHFLCEYIYFTWKTAKTLLSLILSERRLQIHVEPTYHENTPMMKILTLKRFSDQSSLKTSYVLRTRKLTIDFVD
jgi:hypothetical protein